MSDEITANYAEQIQRLQGIKRHMDYCRSILKTPADDVLSESILQLTAENAELKAELEGEREHVQGYLAEIDNSAWETYYKGEHTPAGFRCQVYNSIHKLKREHAELKAKLDTALLAHSEANKAKCTAIKDRDELITRYKERGLDRHDWKARAEQAEAKYAEMRPLIELLECKCDTASLGGYTCPRCQVLRRSVVELIETSQTVVNNAHWEVRHGSGDLERAIITAKQALSETGGEK